MDTLPMSYTTHGKSLSHSPLEILVGIKIFKEFYEQLKKDIWYSTSNKNLLSFMLGNKLSAKGNVLLHNWSWVSCIVFFFDVEGK